MLKCNWALLWWRVTLVFISFYDKAGRIDGNYGDKVSVRSRIFLLNLEWHRTNFSNSYVQGDLCTIRTNSVCFYWNNLEGGSKPKHLKHSFSFPQTQSWCKSKVLISNAKSMLEKHSKSMTEKWSTLYWRSKFYSAFKLKYTTSSTFIYESWRDYDKF